MVKPSANLSLFPVLRSGAYFDHAAIAPLPAPVARAASDFLAEARDHGSRQFFEWRARLDSTREKAAQLLKVNADEMALIHSTSEGINIAATGLSMEPGDNIVTVEREFPANRIPWLPWCDRGVELRIVPWKDLRFDVDSILERVDEKTRVVTVSYVSFIHGARVDLAKLADGIRSRSRALFFVDAIQGMGALPLYPEEWGVDMLAADGHKWLLAPEGVGLFWCRKDKLEHLKPAYRSWLSVTQPFDVEPYCAELLPNARRFEFGSPNTVGAYALDAALDILLKEGIESIAARIKDLTDHLIEGLQRHSCQVMSPREDSHWSGIVAFQHPSLAPRDVRHRLLDARVTVSEREGFVRVAPHFYNRHDQIDALLEALP